MLQHFDDILKLNLELWISGAEVIDIDSVIYIFMSLPRGYNAFKNALENQSNIDLTLECIF